MSINSRKTANSMYKDSKCPYWPNCECLDYCEELDPYSTPSIIVKCRGCGDNVSNKTVIKGLCLNCAKDTYEDKD